MPLTADGLEFSMHAFLMGVSVACKGDFATSSAHQSELHALFGGATGEEGFKDLALLRVAVGAPLIAEFDQAQS